MQDIGLLNALGAKIKYLAKAQEIVAQNVANADTPGYKPQALTEIDFGAIIGRLGAGETVRLKMTNPDHVTPQGTKAGDAREMQQKMTYEVAPAGNAVILEEQLVNANKVRMDYDLAINLYTKNINMLRTALGTGR